MEWLTRAANSSFPSSRLLSLPAELRNQIFSYVVSSPKATVTFHLDSFQRDSYDEAIPPAIARVNRQLRHEVLPLWYENNTLVMHTEASKGDETIRWLRRFESHIPLLRKAEIWLRYVTITRDRTGSQGVIAIPLRRLVYEGDEWGALEDTWRWVTVVRKPDTLQHDAQFLNTELRRLLEERDCECLESEQLRNVMVNLRARYVKHKIERQLRFVV